MRRLLIISLFNLNSNYFPFFILSCWSVLLPVTPLGLQMFTSPSIFFLSVTHSCALLDLYCRADWSRIHVNNVPSSGLVKNSTSMSYVGQNATFTSRFFILSVTKNIFPLFVLSGMYSPNILRFVNNVFHHFLFYV